MRQTSLANTAVQGKLRLRSDSGLLPSCAMAKRTQSDAWLALPVVVCRRACEGSVQDLAIARHQIRSPFRRRDVHHVYLIPGEKAASHCTSELATKLDGSWVLTSDACLHDELIGTRGARVLLSDVPIGFGTPPHLHFFRSTWLLPPHFLFEPLPPP